MTRTKKAKELFFISRILADGSGTVPAKDNFYDDSETVFKLTTLSLSKGTYIATNFSSWVVKIKEPN